jgi:hypothetical protein
MFLAVGLEEQVEKEIMRGEATLAPLLGASLASLHFLAGRKLSEQAFGYIAA